jgi:hypothetical protein
MCRQPIAFGVYYNKCYFCGYYEEFTLPIAVDDYLAHLVDTHTQLFNTQRVCVNKIKETLSIRWKRGHKYVIGGIYLRVEDYLIGTKRILFSKGKAKVLYAIDIKDLKPPFNSIDIEKYRYERKR